MKRLYQVTAEVTVFVVAESEDEALGIAETDAVETEVDTNGYKHASIRTPPSIPAEWRGSLPYGDNEGRSVEQWLEVKP